MSAGSEAPNPTRINHIRRVLTIWAVLSVILVVVVVVVAPMLSPRSESSVDQFGKLTDVVFSALAVPVGLFVWVFVGYSVVVFRERQPTADVDDLPDGPPLQAKPRQQIAWLAITAALAVFLVGWGMFGFYKETINPPAKPLVVDVTGQQWMWTYSYPSLGVQSNQLYLPVNRPVQFRVTSDDVLHGFVVDEFGILMDANPGWWSSPPTVIPKKVGSFDTRCVELCGLYHSYMWSPVQVVSAAQFKSWVASNGGRTT